MLTQVAKAKKTLPSEGIIYSAISGSHLYGVANSDSDIDWKFIYCLSRNDLLGLNPPTEKKMTSDGKFEDGSTKFEWVGHEVGKFCRLLLKGNPTMIELLFAQVDLDRESSSYRYNHWQTLVIHRKEFLTKQVVKQYLGFLNGQLQRLKKKNGTSTKPAYHMLRLGWDLLSIVNGEEPTVFHMGKDRETLLSVRRGDIDLEIITETVRTYIMAVEDAKPWDLLPDEGPRSWLNNWLLRIRGSYFGY